MYIYIYIYVYVCMYVYIIHHDISMVNGIFLTNTHCLFPFGPFDVTQIPIIHGKGRFLTSTRPGVPVRYDGLKPSKPMENG